MDYSLHLIFYATILASAVALFLAFCSWISQEYRIRKNLRKQWKGPPGQWLFGHAGLITDNQKNPSALIEYFAEKQKIYPHGFALHIGPRPILRIHHPEIAKEIFLASANDAPKTPMMEVLFKRWIGKSILILNGGEWSRLRRLLTYSFHFDVLKSYILHMNSCTDTLQKKWETKFDKQSPARIEIFADASLMTLDAILQSLVGYKSNCQIDQKRNPFIASIYALLEGITHRATNKNPFNLLNFFYYNSKNGKKFLKHCNISHEFSFSFINKRREEYLEGTRDQNTKLDFLDTLLQARDSDGTGFTDYEIRSQLDTFLFGGHDTTACAISWLLYHLSLHPELQERCAVEVDAVLGDKSDVEWSHLSSFPFLTRCIKESLRIHPSAPMVTRVLKKDITVEGKNILKGTIVHIGILGIHTNENFWRNPNEFDPDRFTPESAAEQHRYAYIPFAAGQRNCIGQNFAMNEIKVVAAKLLRNFRFTLDTGHKIVPCLEVVYRTKTGLYLFVEKRK